MKESWCNTLKSSYPIPSDSYYNICKQRLSDWEFDRPTKADEYAFTGILLLNQLSISIDHFGMQYHKTYEYAKKINKI